MRMYDSHTGEYWFIDSSSINNTLAKRFNAMHDKFSNALIKFPRRRIGGPPLKIYAARAHLEIESSAN